MSPIWCLHCIISLSQSMAAIYEVNMEVKGNWIGFLIRTLITVVSVNLDRVEHTLNLIYIYEVVLVLNIFLKLKT